MGIIFSIISPAIFALINCVDKFILEKYEISPSVITVYGGTFAFVTGLIVLYFTGLYPIDTKSLLLILASGALTAIYLVPYYKALTLDEASRVIPLFQFYPVFVLILSLILLSEKLTFSQYLGSLIITFGGFLIAVEKVEGKIFKLRKSFFYMMLSSLIFAFAQVFYKFGVTEIPFWNTLPYEGFGIALGSILIISYKNNYKIFIEESRKFKKQFYLYLTFNELLYIAARYTGYFAISLIAVGLVSVLSSLQPLFVLFYTITLTFLFPKILKESTDRTTIKLKFTAIILIIIGSYLVFL